VLLDAALEQVERCGERWQEAEIHRVEGLLHMSTPQPDLAQAQASFECAIAVAREQGARSWELRARTTLARLCQREGRFDEARSLLQPLLSNFSEGAQSRDVREACGVLDSLEQPG
jgi:predicted ATPase